MPIDIPASLATLLPSHDAAQAGLTYLIMGFGLWGSLGLACKILERVFDRPRHR
jgi:hypothetical protein